MTNPALPNLKYLPFGGASAVDSLDSYNLVDDLLKKSTGSLRDTTAHTRFTQQYIQWIKSSKLNNLSGLDAFPVSAYSNGTTEAFDKFYLKHHQRRFRCFRGEYMYHVGSWKNYHKWAYLDQDDLDTNDALVLSLPFSDLGNIHPDTLATLDRCHQLGIPVLIDCAFFGLCSNINFDLDHPAITEITFSLSKTLPVSNLRIGMRLTRYDDDDGLMINNKTNYVNLIGASVGLEIFRSITPDYNWLTWHKTQHEFCNQLKVRPSDTVIFGLATGDWFKEYNRGGPTHRLTFYKYLEKQALPNLVQL